MLAVLLAVGGGASRAAAAERHGAAHFGLGVASVVCTLVYGPIKTTYAVLGSITGGLAYVLTGFDGATAHKIIQPAIRGDYVVVPENLTSERPLTFAGRDPRQEPYPYR